MTLFLSRFLICSIGAVVIVLTLIVLGTKSASVQQNGPDALETRRLYLGGSVATGLGFLLTISMLMAYCGENKEEGMKVFDTMKVILPPIITLVLGYYFGSANSTNLIRKKHEDS